MPLAFSLSAVQCLRLLLVILLLCCPPPHSTNLSPVLAEAAQTCPSNPNTPVEDTAIVDGHGTLDPFLSSAKSTREVILSDELPYDVIRDEIRKQLSSTFDISIIMML